MTYVYGKTITPAARAQREANQWRTRATIAEARVTELEGELDTAQRSARKYKALAKQGNAETRNATATEMNRLTERLAALEKELRGTHTQNRRLRDENLTLRTRHTTQTTLRPGDTPEVCAARLEAATREANPGPGRPPQSHCHRGHAMTEANSLRDGDRRKCRTCHNDRRRENRAKRAAEQDMKLVA